MADCRIPTAMQGVAASTLEAFAGELDKLHIGKLVYVSM